ncbi:MAG: hypothetical protein ABIG84_04065 [archaeon]
MHIKVYPHNKKLEIAQYHQNFTIFYAAKALLLTKGIDPKPPEIHKRTYEEFRKEFVDTGILDLEL